MKKCMCVTIILIVLSGLLRAGDDQALSVSEYRMQLRARLMELSANINEPNYPGARKMFNMVMDESSDDKECIQVVTKFLREDALRMGPRDGSLELYIKNSSIAWMLFWMKGLNQGLFEASILGNGYEEFITDDFGLNKKIDYGTDPVIQKNITQFVLYEVAGFLRNKMYHRLSERRYMELDADMHRLRNIIKKYGWSKPIETLVNDWPFYYDSDIAIAHRYQTNLDDYPFSATGLKPGKSYFELLWGHYREFVQSQSAENRAAFFDRVHTHYGSEAYRYLMEHDLATEGIVQAEFIGVAVQQCLRFKEFNLALIMLDQRPELSRDESLKDLLDTQLTHMKQALDLAGIARNRFSQNGSGQAPESKNSNPANMPTDEPAKTQALPNKPGIN